jgi:hypothetical protein
LAGYSPTRRRNLSERPPKGKRFFSRFILLCPGLGRVVDRIAGSADFLLPQRFTVGARMGMVVPSQTQGTLP